MSAALPGPDDWTPPPRSILYVKPVPASEGGGLEVACDCGGLTQLIIEGLDQLTEPRELAFTCDGCQSVHWFTLTPAGSQAMTGDGEADPAKITEDCPSCGSEVRSERCYVPGRTGMPVSCNDEWHDEEDDDGQ